MPPIPLLLAGAAAAPGIFRGIKGLFGGGRRRRRENELRDRTSSLADQFQGRFDNISSQGPADTQVFNQGLGSLFDLIGGQRRRDEGRATALGAQGGELELAQAAGRQRTLGGGLRDLLSLSERSQQNREGQAGSQLLGATSLDLQGILELIRGDRQKRGQTLGLLGSLGRSAGSAFAGSG